MLLRFSYLFLLIAAAIGAFFYVYFTRQSDHTPAYVGSERCAVCHSQASIGAQYRRWLSSPHARADSALASDSALALISAASDGPASCLPCHTTIGRSPHGPFEQAMQHEGVGCERCHGPGSKYSVYNVMLDSGAFRARGGVIGSLKDCYQCHAQDLAGSTKHCPFQKADFNADSAWARIKHPVLRQSSQPDTVLKLRTP
jgi:hypothetical protein